jgi:hypothetical protein
MEECMHRRLFLGRLVLVAAVAAGFAGPAAASGPLDLKVEYSADALVGSGDAARPGKLWRTPNSVRLETLENGRPQTVIVRVDRSIAWLLIPDMRLAVETELSGLALTQALFGRSDSFKFSALGPDTVEGTRTTRWQIETADPPRAGNPGAGWFRGLVWTRADGVVMKIEGEGEHRSRRGYVHLLFRNVRVGRQESALFVPPAEFRRLPVSETMIDTLLKGLEQMQRLRSGAPQ